MSRVGSCELGTQTTGLSAPRHAACGRDSHVSSVGWDTLSHEYEYTYVTDTTSKGVWGGFLLKVGGGSLKLYPGVSCVYPDVS